MRNAIFRVGAHAGPIITAAACWVLVFQLNGYLFSALEQSRWVHWVFLPAGVRVLALLLFGKHGAIGLVVGAAVTLAPQDMILPNAVILPLTSGLAPWIAVHFWKRQFRIRDDLFGLNPVHIVILSGACAIANSVVLNLFLVLAGQGVAGTVQLVAVMIGDATGTAIILFLMSLTLSSARSRPRHL